MIIDQANLAGIYKSFSTIFNQAFDAAQSQWPLVAMPANSTGAGVDYKWLGDMPTMREWIGDRVIKDLSAFHYELVNKSFESTIEVDRDNIEDDQIGVYSPLIQEMARSAKVHPDILVFTLLAKGFTSLCFDGQYFFDTDHPVNGKSVSNYGGGSGAAWYLMDLSRAIKPLILQIRKRPEFVAQTNPESENVFMRKKYRYGVDDRKNVGFGLWQLAYASKDTLDETNYAAARAAMSSLTKDDGETKLGITPTHVIVGPTGESAGRKVVEAQNKAGGESNIWYNTAKLVVVPWLT